MMMELLVGSTNDIQQYLDLRFKNLNNEISPFFQIRFSSFSVIFHCVFIIIFSYLPAFFQNTCEQTRKPATPVKPEQGMQTRR